MSNPSSYRTDRYAAAQRLAELDELNRRTDISAEAVYRAAIDTVNDNFPATDCRLTFIGSDQQRVLGMTDHFVSSTVTALREHPITVDSLIRIEVGFHSPDNEPTGEFRCEFLDAILDSVAFAFLKEQYQTRIDGKKTPTAEPENPPLISNRRSNANRRGAKLFIGFVSIAVAILCVPVSFKLPIEGVIEPTHFRNIFAPHGGTLVKRFVEDGQDVSATTQLVEIDSADIQLQSERLFGELTAAQTELLSLRLNRTHPSPSGRDAALFTESPSNSRRQVILKARVRSLQKQVDIIDEMRESLTVQANINGRIRLPLDRHNLNGQNVIQGQWLMQVVGADSGYRATLDLADTYFGYLQDAQSRSPDLIDATMRLRSQPELSLAGTVTAVTPVVARDVRGDGIVEVIVTINDPPIGGLRLGSSVVGDLHVGKRRLGFVLFRPLIELLRSYGW